MRKEIVELRERMRDEGMDAYYIPSSDFHGSEYMHPYFEAREFISGFTGSAGDLLVDSDGAYLWTDGRYFLQAEQQLSGSGIKLMKMGDENVPTVTEFIAGKAREISGSSDKKFVLGFDGRVVRDEFVFDLEDEEGCDFDKVRIRWDKDLAGMIWEERPPLRTNGLWMLPIESAGISAGDKIANIRNIMKKNEADYLAVADLGTVAWILNLRGSDVAYTPVFYSYLLISRDRICIYLTDDAIRSGAEDLIDKAIGGSEDIQICGYDDFYRHIDALELGEDDCFMADNFMSYSMYRSLMKKNCVISVNSEVSMLKSIKNDVEISCARRAHIKDGVAVTRFIKWIKEETLAGKPQSEITAADYLEGLRREQDGFIEPSFSTIAGYGGNGAIVHYKATEETDAKIKAEGFLLVDSGGQYRDGTTDITRTIALGDLTDEMIHDYTCALKSHIAYAGMRYKEGMSGIYLDDMVRKPMRDEGLDFNHGISHGVGHVLGVHENAAVIRSTNKLDAGIKAGMIMSDEPGVYKENKYGIRIENLVLFKDDGAGGVINEPLTCVPYERRAIDKTMLSEDEIKWVNDYHRWVRDTLTPLLDPDTSKFLSEETLSI